MRYLPQGSMDSRRVVRGIGSAAVLVVRQGSQLWRSAFTGALAIGLGHLVGTGVGLAARGEGSGLDSAATPTFGKGRSFAEASWPAA